MMNIPVLAVSLAMNLALAGCIWAAIARNRKLGKQCRVERLKRRVAE
jgi:hypothetical protein